MTRLRYLGAACALLIAPAAFVAVYVFMLVVSTPPSCQDGPCARDEQLDGPAPLVAHAWFVLATSAGAAAIFIFLALWLAAGPTLARRLRRG